MSSNPKDQPTSNGPRLLKDSSAQWHVEHASTLLIPSSDDDTRAQLILVLVAHPLKQCRDSRNRRGVTVDGGVKLAMLVNGVGDGLRVGCGSRTTTIDPVMDMRELISDSVGLELVTS